MAVRMTDQPQASKLAREAFDQWQAGHHVQSRILYQEAILLADSQYWGLSTYHGEYACVLNALGEHEQATTQFKKSLDVELAQNHPEGSPNVTIARYFLADQLRQYGSLEAALETLEPSISHAPHDWCTRLVEARIRFALGQKTEAKISGFLAISNAPTPRKAAELEQVLGEILGTPDD